MRVHPEADDGSHSEALIEALPLRGWPPRVEVDLDHRDPLFENTVPPDQPGAPFAGLELELQVADERARELPRTRGSCRRRARRRDESAADPNPMRASSEPVEADCMLGAYVVSKSVAGELAADPLQADGSPFRRARMDVQPRQAAMHDGIVSRSLRYITIGSAVFAPSGNATVGDVGVTRTSKRLNASLCSRINTVRTLCAWP